MPLSRGRDGTARFAEVHEVALHGEEPIEVPAGEDLRGVVAIAEVDTDVVDVVEIVDLVDGRREVADTATEIEPLGVVAGTVIVFLRERGSRHQCQ